MSATPVLVRPRWVVAHVLVLALVILFVNFGLWQLRRLESRVETNALVAARTTAPAAPLEELLSEFAPERLEYRTAVVHGRFDPGNELFLRGRSREGQAGWHVLTPLVLGDGTAVLVDRGWIPYRMDGPPATAAPPPEGDVEASGRIRLEQDPPRGRGAALAPRDPPDGRLDRPYYVDVERLAAQMPYPLAPVYLELTWVEGAVAGEYPLVPELPEQGRGPHLSYALQWFSFAVIGIVGYLLLLRKTARGAGREAESDYGRTGSAP